MERLDGPYADTGFRLSTVKCGGVTFGLEPSHTTSLGVKRADKGVGSDDVLDEALSVSTDRGAQVGDVFAGLDLKGVGDSIAANVDHDRGASRAREPSKEIASPGGSKLGHLLSGDLLVPNGTVVSIQEDHARLTAEELLDKHTLVDVSVALRR